MEYLMGLYVTDDEMYGKYRAAMYPILQTYGGDFGYDFKIKEVLKSEVKEPINRVFTIYFKDEQAKIDFFSNEEYLSIKEKFFNESVSSVTEIAQYKK
ncbi:MAG: DUF1330 domain-containing protein [Bacteroidetes bacterium]|nr:MAG: DUF1330 domain-containing protein [Bacteroidota bacterium]